MFSRKKPDKPKRNHTGGGNNNLTQFGLFDIPSDLNPMDAGNDSDGDNSDLEAELAALAGGTSSSASSGRSGAKKMKKPLPQKELDSLVSMSLKDIGDEDEEDVDENDPDLLSELQEIAGDDNAEENNTPVESLSRAVPEESSSESVNILMNRLKNYQIAEDDAKKSNEMSKAKRFNRAIKVLNDLVKKAKAGEVIDLNDEMIPPEIKIKPKEVPDQIISKSEDFKPVVPSRRAPKIPEDSNQLPSLSDTVQNNVAEVKKEVDEELLNMLLDRQKEYKIAALQAKKTGDTQSALGYLKIAKIFDQVIEAVKSGQAVDLSDMPGSPDARVLSKLQENETQKQSDTPKNSEIVTPSANPTGKPESGLITAGTVQEALQQRLEFYKIYEQKSKDEENSSKARRYGRIVKQYEQAIKAYKAGRTVPFDELPSPPGFGPLPIPNSQPSSASDQPSGTPKQTSSQDNNVQGDKNLAPSPSSRISGNKVSTTHQEKQVLILQAKQKQFKVAALNAKKKGEIMEAKEYLKQAKGFEKLIEAAQAGLPVDWATIPVSPGARSQLDNEYDIVMTDECTENDDTDSDVLSRLENQLTKQLKMCLTTRDHNKALGDVAGTNRFERLALNVTKDLDVVRVAKKTNGRIPKFHYETKEFAIVKSFTELTDNDLELVIIRGINYRSDNPKDIDTYVKFEFPFPQETPYTDKTSIVKDTNNPEYNHTVTIPIQRNSRQCQRVFKRHGIKLEVFAKGCDCGCASDIFSCFSGFFRSDSLVGTVNLKLQPLETQCEIHDSFELMDGRRKTGGKLEIRLRLRSPIVTQQVEQIKEKWLIFDQ